MSEKFAKIRRRSGRECGIAIVLVLWVLALLSILVLGLLRDADTDVKIARNEEQAVEARAIADAGVTQAILGLFDPSPATRWHADGEWHSLAYDGGTIRVSVQDEMGKIDINAAPRAMLSNLFQTLGFDRGLADQLGRNIVDWRAGGVNALRGASSDVVAQRRFLAVAELRLVPGVTRAIFERVAPFVTVYSGVSRIDPFTAPAEDLRSLPGANMLEVDTFLQARAQLGPDSAALPALTGVGAWIIHSPLRVFGVMSEARTSGGASFVRKAVAVLTGLPQAPYRFLTWKRLDWEPGKLRPSN